MDQNLDRDSGNSLSLLHLPLGPQPEDERLNACLVADAGFQLEASVFSLRGVSRRAGWGFRITW